MAQDSAPHGTGVGGAGGVVITTQAANDSIPAASERLTIRRSLFTISWIGLLVLAAFPILAAIADLLAISRTGIPSDHEQTFHAITGISSATARASASGLFRYISLLEVGYAVHELVFGVLFLAVVIFGVRKAVPWAWFTSWAALLADVVYSFTFGTHSETVLRQSLIADIGLPIMLVLAGATGAFRAGRRS